MLLGSAFLLLAVLPTELITRGPSLCLFKHVFGVACLGCGMTRAMSSLLHAEAGAALAYNKLVVVVFPLLCGLLLKDLFSILHLKARSRRDDSGWQMSEQADVQQTF